MCINLAAEMGHVSVCTNLWDLTVSAPAWWWTWNLAVCAPVWCQRWHLQKLARHIIHTCHLTRPSLHGYDQASKHREYVVEKTAEQREFANSAQRNDRAYDVSSREFILMICLQ